MSNPIVGLGTTVEFASVASPAVFTVLAGAQSASFSGDKVAVEKTTTLLSTNGVDTFVSSTQDPGSLDIKALYEPGDASQIALEAIRLAGVAVNWKVVYPLSLGSASFSGIVESMTRTFPLDKVCELSIKVKISGAVTIA